MNPISVVIIAKNEARTLVKSIPLLKQISDDIIVIDNESNDQTVTIATAYGCKVFQKVWLGYAANKNKGNQLARHNWILSVDGDEIPDEALISSIKSLVFDNDTTVYDIAFKTYFGGKLIRFGNWGRDHHIRLFNKLHIKWNETPVHETLQLQQNVTIKKLEGNLHHYSVKSRAEYEKKTIHYSQLSAIKYLKAGKKAGLVKLYLAPLFHFVKTYLFLLGFLDGKEGLIISRMAFKSTWLKYHYLSKAAQSLKHKQLYPHDIPALAFKLNTPARVE